MVQDCSATRLRVRARKSSKRRRTGLSRVEEARLREQLRGQCPSEPWVEAQFKQIRDVDADGRAVVCRYHDPHVFPPGGDATAMVRCPRCGVLTPPNAFEHGACLDHARHDGWGSSPSAVTIRQLQFYNLRMEESPLEPEDEASLRKEITACRPRAKKRSDRPTPAAAGGCETECKKSTL